MTLSASKAVFDSPSITVTASFTNPVSGAPQLMSGVMASSFNFESSTGTFTVNKVFAPVNAATWVAELVMDAPTDGSGVVPLTAQFNANQAGVSPANSISNVLAVDYSPPRASFTTASTTSATDIEYMVVFRTVADNSLAKTLVTPASFTVSTSMSYIVTVMPEGCPSGQPCANWKVTVHLDTPLSSGVVLVSMGPGATDVVPPNDAFAAPSVNFAPVTVTLTAHENSASGPVISEGASTNSKVIVLKAHFSQPVSGLVPDSFGLDLTSYVSPGVVWYDFSILGFVTPQDYVVCIKVASDATPFAIGFRTAFIASSTTPKVAAPTDISFVYQCSGSDCTRHRQVYSFG